MINTLVTLSKNRQFQSIACIQVFNVFGANLLAPVLPLYLSLQGLSASHIGMVMGHNGYRRFGNAPMVRTSRRQGGQSSGYPAGPGSAWLLFRLFSLAHKFWAAFADTFYTGRGAVLLFHSGRHFRQ